MEHICRHCEKKYFVTDTDRDFYEKVSPSFNTKQLSVPPPTLCPDCRSQERMAIRNEKTLYARTCDLCHKDMISIYSGGTSFPVYCQECYWGDNWDASIYATDYDLEKDFFSQFATLMKKVPRLGIINKQAQNSDYCNYSFANKNCYLTFGNHYEEDCMYGRYSTKNKNTFDYLCMYQSELCYECILSKNCYRSVFLDHCEDCQNCYFSTDLKGCKNCLFSANLRHKEYYIFNKPYSQEEYEQKLAAYNLGSFAGFTEAQKVFLEEVKNTFPARALYQVNCESCEGENHENCKNLQQCFDCTDCEDLKYVTQADAVYTGMDMTCMGYDRSELCYQLIGCTGTFHCLFSDSCFHNNDLLYCQLCFSSKNCFGCISMKHKEYCILNKQYTKEAYEELIVQIIESMMRDKQWGEFFPIPLSPYAYNEVIAQEYFPITLEQAQKYGWQWKERDMREYQKPSNEIPDHIDTTTENVMQETLACATCRKNYRITKQEFAFYKNMHLPVPRKCPDCRHQDRMQRRNPRKLWERACAKCNQQIQTTYVPEKLTHVYCQNCYEQLVY